MKTLILAAIRCSLMFTAVTGSLFFVRPAQGGYIVTLQEVGTDAVATGSGAIDLTGLSFVSTLPSVSHINPFFAIINTGESFIDTGTRAFVDFYKKGGLGGPGFGGPTSFGSLFADRFADSGSGDLVGIDGFDGFLLVPHGYVSGTALSDSATYDDYTFASHGIIPGTYVWSWGTGANQNFTLQIVAGVPDAGSTLPLLGFALLGLVALGRKLRC